jgi:hypothetical protein
VTVPQGSTAATFSVTGGAVTIATSVTLTASYSGVSSSAVLTVNPASQTATVSFLGTDTATQGNWNSTYNYTGVVIIGNSSSIPGYASVTASHQNSNVWSSSTRDTRALQKLSSLTDRIAADWYSPNNLYIDINFFDHLTHQVAIYLLDWDYKGRAETISILDAKTNAVLDTRSGSNFGKGVYLNWNVSGHVKLQITKTSGKNAVVSGIFLN